MKRTLTWFPGHMAKALRGMERTMKQADLVLEVVDARVPHSSRNDKLDSIIGRKRRLVVLNKADLADPQSIQAVLQRFKEEGVRAVATAADRPHSVRQLLRAAVGWLQAERPQSSLSLVMVVGLPNVGKSSLINKLRAASNTDVAGAATAPDQPAKRRKAIAGPEPGLTRDMSAFLLSASPQVFLLDTPGIMMPTIRDDHTGRTLALAGSIKDSIVGPEAIVRHLVALLCVPRHQAALEDALTQLLSSPRSGSRAAGRSGARGSTPTDPGDSAADSRRSHLWRVRQRLGSDATPHAALARMMQALLGAALLDPSAQPWHPALEDPGFGEMEQRFEALMEALGVAGAADPSQRLGACCRLLKAFRQGELGQYMLDDL